MKSIKIQVKRNIYILLNEEGKDKLKNILGIDTKKNKTTKEGDVKDKVKDVFGGLFGKKKK